MKQLPEPIELIVDEYAPTPLFVMGEKERHIHNQHHGYVFKNDDSRTVAQRQWLNQY